MPSAVTAVQRGPAAEIAAVRDATTVAEARECDKVKAALQAALDVANGNATSRAQKIQKFQIVPEDFSVPGGELGPTLKLKRPPVVEKYGDVIRGMYGADWKE